jgi:hypothetical protein
MKIKMKGQRLEDTLQIQVESQVVLDSITKQEFQKCFQQWKRCWVQCMNSKEDCFEGKNTNP